MCPHYVDQPANDVQSRNTYMFELITWMPQMQYAYSR